MKGLFQSLTMHDVKLNYLSPPSSFSTSPVNVTSFRPSPYFTLKIYKFISDKFLQIRHCNVSRVLKVVFDHNLKPLSSNQLLWIIIFGPMHAVLSVLYQYLVTCVAKMKLAVHGRKNKVLAKSANLSAFSQHSCLKPTPLICPPLLPSSTHPPGAI